MTIDKWDLIIAHPPCTYLTVTGNRWFDTEKYGDAARQRLKDRYKAIVFFMQMALANCDKIAVENPVGIMGTAWRSADQVIQPYMFAESIDDKENYVTKATCLWLKGLPPLKPTNNLPKPNNREIYGVMPSGKAKTWEDSLCRAGGAAKARSKTFSGVAREMSRQWGEYLLNYTQKGDQ